MNLTRWEPSNATRWDPFRELEDMSTRLNRFFVEVQDGAVTVEVA